MAERVEHAVCRQRTPEEARGIGTAIARRMARQRGLPPRLIEVTAYNPELERKAS